MHTLRFADTPLLQACAWSKDWFIFYSRTYFHSEYLSVNEFSVPGDIFDQLLKFQKYT